MKVLARARAPAHPFKQPTESNKMKHNTQQQSIEIAFYFHIARDLMFRLDVRRSLDAFFVQRLARVNVFIVRI